MKLFKKKNAISSTFSKREEGAYILALTNQKGGVGKTTTAVNLAAGLAEQGVRVLLIDLDPQGNASTGLGIDYAQRANKGSYALLLEEENASSLLTPSVVRHLSVITATGDLAGAELELVDSNEREFRLKKALDDVRSQFDIILIDCPPSLGLLTLNALVAADSAIVPLQCEFFALEGISHLAKTVGRVKQAFNEKLKIEGIVLTMYDRRNNLSSLVAEDARSYFGTQVLQTVIGRNVRIPEAQSHGKPVMMYDPRSPGAQAYRDLTEEILNRITSGS